MPPRFKIKLEPSPAMLLGKPMKVIKPALARAILRAAESAADFIREEVINRHAGGTGTLAVSFQPTLLDTQTGLTAGALSDLPYARVQTEGTGYLPGGVISPKKKYLAIPQTPIARAQWPRGWSKKALYFIPKAGGAPGGYLIEKATDTLQYVLRPSVKLEGSGYLKAAKARVDKELPKQIIEDVAAEMKKAVGAGNG